MKPVDQLRSDAARPLNNEELNALDDLLLTISDDESMSVEEIDGFFAALACCPLPIPPIEYLGEIFGKPTDIVQNALPAADYARAVKYIDRHRASVLGQLQLGASFAPILNTDDDGRALAYGWAIGFARGMGLRPDAWAPIEDDEDLDEVFVPVMELVEEANEVGDEPPESLTKADCDERINAMLDGVFDAYQFFKVERDKNLGPREPILRDAPKTGRNDVCRCGSGKKFKLCHGAK